MSTKTIIINLEGCNDPTVPDRLDAIEASLQNITSALQTVQLQENIQMADLSALLAAAEQETTVDNSIIALLNSIAAQLAQAGVDQATIDGVVAELTSNAAAVSAAVTANTPAAPPEG